MVDEDCAVVFYSILNAISTLDMSLQAPDFETYKKVVANGMGMFYKKLPVFRFANMHRNANSRYWSETFSHLADIQQETGEELPL